MDVTISLMLNQSTHALPIENEGGRWRNGQIINMYLTRNLKVTLQGDGTYKFDYIIGNPRIGFIHIREMPASNARKMNFLLGETNELPNGHVISRRLWRVRRGSLPPAARDKLLTNKELTVSWAQFKSFTQLDSNNRNLTDADVT